MVPFQVAATPRMTTQPMLQMRDLDHYHFEFAIGTFSMEAQVMVLQNGNYRDWRLGYLQLVTEPESTHYYIIDPGAGGAPAAPNPDGAILVSRTTFPPGAIRDAPTPITYGAHPFASEHLVLRLPDREMRAGDRLYLPLYSDTPGAAGASHPRSSGTFPCFIDGFIKRGTFHTYVVAFNRATGSLRALYVVKWVLECERHGLAFEAIRQSYRRWLGDAAARVRFSGRPWFRLVIREHHPYQNSDTPIQPEHVAQSPAVMRTIDREAQRQFSWTWTAPTRWAGVRWG